jgi:hypothetical protein
MLVSITKSKTASLTGLYHRGMLPRLRSSGVSHIAPQIISWVH